MADISTVDLVQIIFWFLAGCVSFYFSIDNARVWTSISMGFFLIFLSQLYVVEKALDAPWTAYTQLEAIHYIIGTVAIMVMTHGFQEYYIFSRTLELGGSKHVVYLSILGILVGSVVFVFANPEPQYPVLRNIAMIENSTWVFLSLVNIDIIRKIYLQIRDSVIANGFIAFGVVFITIFLWKGSELYLQVYNWDYDWQIIMQNLGVTLPEQFMGRRQFSLMVHDAAGLASGLTAGGTFLYLLRLLR
ncbi:hypothetical protein KIP69_07370 [Geobacter sulfurreducens]|uniref:Membrane protein, putative n=1 Tax=Geobacter sulfurreducens (strain ATCC 51573 / DSM 12127 / PCA) TaxID=243231 RepID=Q74D46_GEOSL|nr:hypothetical protein [Geobacter sulfurreducens]AAR34847.1 membrane protein, putative [Geobacter sulfurreducens PCA]ADI84312.1 membrane protein, putative [Geobacter sulfurreducens KN400]AJY71647.1 membrane protein [Geobacter sulfurreducens]QVW36651.1 hypothetical protein KIP69_07370 [Geobacter sulfurreducens]UAC05487.1 hypothetical protein KVP06_07360 [Geobacter sulfurreducens]